MPQMDPIFRAHLEASLLGRLKLKLFEHITGSVNEFPDHKRFRQFVLRESRKNMEVVKLLASLANLTSCAKVSFDSLPSEALFLASLDSLEDEPLSGAFFIEVNNCLPPFSPTIGAFIYCEELEPEGQVYVVSLLDEDGFPNPMARAEIRASRASPEPCFSLLGHSGYQHASFNTYSTDSYVRFLAKLLVFAANNRQRKLLSIKEVLSRNLELRYEHTPPEDLRLMELLHELVCGNISCTEVDVSISLVIPHNLDFALSMPQEVIADAEKYIQTYTAPRILLYWENGKFVMSDCYPIYLALRKLKNEIVGAVVLGQFPKEAVIHISRIGGDELLPPLLVEKGGDDLTPELKQVMLDARLSQKPLTDSLADVYGTFLEFTAILQRPKVQEADVHNFLKHHPVVLDAYGNQIISEVRLGDSYRIDLVIQQKLNNCRLILVELESPKAKLFTKNGRPRAEVTHALQQVEDWLRWLRENPDRAPNGLDPRLPVHGLVVIGRGDALSEEDHFRLLNLNANRQIQLITYDDLLSKLEALIINLEH